MSRAAPGDGQVSIRRATRRDLDALVELEQGFPGDRMSRAGLSRLLERDSAEVWVAVLGEAVVGDAVVLFRHGFDSARLYSMVVDPQYRGRGVAKMLLGAAEEGARERGVVVMRLEVREENSPALALYRQAGYSVRGRTDDYYEDHAAALRLLKRFVSGGATVKGVPYHAQTLSFTSGSVCLMMAMRYHGYPVPLDGWLELTLWREATSTFGMSGNGGLSAHGLAVAALRRGFHARLITPDSGVPFAAELTGEAKEVARAAHAGFERELRSLGGKVEAREFGHQDAAAAVEAGAIALTLLGGLEANGAEVPTAGRWVVITGFDADHLYVHDPLLAEGAGRADNVHLALKRSLFKPASHHQHNPLRALIVVERWGSVTHRSPDN
jgi:ribosomal protein S18 acetylase RimI-like enzyme